MNWMWAGLICTLAAGFEGLCAGRDPLRQLKALRQPSWSPPNWVWVLIGIAWYGVCFIALARLIPLWPQQKIPVVLLVALMLANAAANVPAFRMRRLDLALAFFLPYWLLLAAFLWSACPLDDVICRLFAIYTVYQIYAAACGYQLWRLNRPTP